MEGIDLLFKVNCYNLRFKIMNKNNLIFINFYQYLPIE